LCGLSRCSHRGLTHACRFSAAPCDADRGQASEDPAAKAAKAEAKALADQAAKDEKAALEAAKAKAKALAARGAPAKIPASAASTDVKVSLRSGVLPGLKDLRLPSSIGLTLPALGPLRVDLNVAISKATPDEVADADVVVSLPTDLVNAAKLAVGGDAGLAYDVPGLGNGRLDVDLSTPRKGEADLALTSSAIPKLPLQKSKGLGRFCFECGTPGGQQSDWFVARNLGNGIQFYGNAKTGVSQFDVPKGF